MFDKALDTYPSAIQFAIECFTTEEMCGEAVDTCLF